MTPFSTRLRTRLVLMALVIVVPALAVIGYDQSVQRRQARQRAVEDTLRVAHLAANQQAAVFDGVQRLLLTLSKFPGLLEQQPTACLALLPNVRRDHPNYLGLWVDNADGSPFCSAVKVNRAQTSRGRSWFERALNSRTTSAGDYQIGLTSEQREIVLAQPLLNAGGDVERILAVAIGLDQLSAIASRTKIPRNAILALADRNGTILARYPESARWVGKQEAQALNGAQLSGPEREKFVETAGIDGVRRFYAVVGVDTGLVTGLYVTMGIEPASVFVENNRLLRQHLLLLGLVTFIAVAIALIGGQIFVLRPVEKFRDVTLRIAEGDFSARAQLEAGPVISHLGEAVNTMAIALETHQRERDVAGRALRDAEERMRFALEAAHVGIWEADLKSGVSFWSNICETMHGLVPGSFEGRFEAFLNRVHADDRDAVVQAIEQSAHEHKNAEFEYRTQWPDASVHRIVMNGHYTYDDAGTPVRGAGIAIDVTERRSLEEQLKQSQKMEAIGQLAGGIAHDFNNMLTVILGNTEFALDELPADHPRRADIEEIRKAALRAAALTHQLLAFSRKQMLAPRVLRLGHVVGELIPMLQRLLGETVELKTVLGDQHPVKADQGQLEQVLVNLSVNARDAMPGGGSLTIETADVLVDQAFARRHPPIQPGPHVRIIVGDTGGGMDPATQKRIFEPFFTTKPAGQGTGLGLATVYGIVQQSDGHIMVESAVGHGTTFTLYLPRTDEMEESSAAAAGNAKAPPGVETILLVEDEQLVRELVFKMLSHYGYTVHPMEDAKAAIAFAQAHRDIIHLVLSDVVLPGMSGPAMVTTLRALHPESKVLYISGYTDDYLGHHGVLDSDMWFLQKPFTADALVTKVREVLDSVVPLSVSTP